MTREELKISADRLIRELPENVTWDDLMYRIYVRQKIERGLEDSENGRVRTTDQLRKDLGLVG